MIPITQAASPGSSESHEKTEGRNAKLADVRELLECALYDLERGWPAAAYDAIGRALRLLEKPR